MSEDRIWTEEALARAADALYDAWLRSGHADDLSEHHIAKLSLDDINGQLTAAIARAQAAEADNDSLRASLNEEASARIDAEAALADKDKRIADLTAELNTAEAQAFTLRHRALNDDALTSILSKANILAGYGEDDEQDGPLGREFIKHRFAFRALLDRAQFAELALSTLRRQAEGMAGALEPFAKLGWRFHALSVVEVCEPHPDNPSSNIEPVRIEVLARAHMALSAFRASSTGETK